MNNAFTAGRPARRQAKTIGFTMAALGLLPSIGAAAGYTFQALNLPDGVSSTQVRDAAIGLAVGYTIRPNPNHPYQAFLEAAAWRLDGSGAYINLHRVPPNLPPGVNMLTSEALGVDNHHQIGGMANRLSVGTVGGAEGVYWSDPQALPFPLAAQATPQLERSTIQDVDGRWAVGEGHRLSGPNPISDTAFAWDVTSGARFALLGPQGEKVTYPAEITGRTVVGSRQFTIETPTGYENFWRPLVWDLGPNQASGDLSGLSVRELPNGGLPIAYASGVNESERLVVGQGRGPATGSFNHALAWDLDNPSADPIDLHDRLPPPFQMSAASDALGDLVIGSTVDPNDIMNLRAVAWDLSDGGFIDLHQFLPADVVHSSGTAINHSGQIVGDFRRADGSRGVFVLTPDHLPGDANQDGVVNLVDFNILAANFGEWPRAFSQGDFNFDGQVNLLDFNRLAGHFGLQAGPDGPTPDDWAALAGAVPEPGAAAPLSLVLLPVLRRRCRRSSQGDRILASGASCPLPPYSGRGLG